MDRSGQRLPRGSGTASVREVTALLTILAVTHNDRVVGYILIGVGGLFCGFGISAWLRSKGLLP